MTSSRIATLLAERDPALIDQLEGLMKLAVEKVNARGGAQDCSAELAEIERLTGIRYEPEFFFEIWSWTEERDVAEQAVYGAPEPMSDLSSEELMEALEIVHDPGARSQFMVDYLERCFPKAFTNDLLYYPHRDLTDEELVEEVFRRKRLLAEGGEAALDEYLVQLAQTVMADPDAKMYSQQWAHGVLNRRQ